MNEFDFTPEFSAESATIFMRRTGNRADELLFDDAFAGSGLAEWVDERRTRFAEFIEPQILYVDNESLHRVGWVYHTGLSGDEDSPDNYAVYHVACDCAAEAESAAHPSEVLTCEVMLDVLEQRARQLGQEQRVADVLSSCTYFDEEVMDLQLSQLGQEILLRSIAHILETDKRHPQTWMANPISGLHRVGTLAVITHQSTADVMPALERLEEGGVVEIHGDTVKLDPAAL